MENTHGIRNIWVADGPAFRPRQITDYRNDDGRQISDLILPAVGKYMVLQPLTAMKARHVAEKNPA